MQRAPIRAARVIDIVEDQRIARRTLEAPVQVGEGGLAALRKPVKTIGYAG